ncbi:MAG: LytTR family transcriptional regulator [Bacteroidales bacterium]|nr:LytTR family transcriptional regulator [Bacteroidales bacterium]
MEYLLVKIKSSIRKIIIAEIVCIVYKDGQNTLYKTDGSKTLYCSSLIKLENQLPDCFIRINRHVIINTKCVASIHKNNKKVTLNNDETFDVSRRKRTLLVKAFNKYLEDLNNEVE